MEDDTRQIRPFMPDPGELTPALHATVINEQRRAQLTRFLSIFGLLPKDSIWARLNRAFIHRSYRTEAGLDEDNERLEFLGDSVIGLAVTEYLLRKYPTEDEGWLSKLRAAVVSRTILGEVGQQMGIGEFVLLGQGEEKSGGRNRLSILGSTLEATCGVLHVHYSWEELRTALCRTVVIPGLKLVQENHLVDYKSRLQEWTQKEFQQVPDYVVKNEGGPDHAKVFDVEAWLGKRLLGVGRGRRKKLAENDAARCALVALGLVSPDESPASGNTPPLYDAGSLGSAGMVAED